MQRNAELYSAVNNFPRTRKFLPRGVKIPKILPHGGKSQKIFHQDGNGTGIPRKFYPVMKNSPVFFAPERKDLLCIFQLILVFKQNLIIWIAGACTNHLLKY